MALTGKRIVLTGGSGGLGKLVADELLRDGADLIVISRTWIGRGNDRVRHIAIDLSTANGIAEASTVVAREQPDILVNMAGVQYFGPAESQSFEDMHTSYMVNLVAPGALCKACLSAMKRRNAGQIANIGSIFGSIPLAHFAAYSSAKAGLRAFSEALRRELAGTGITVTYVAPRAVRTPMLTPELQQYADLTGMNIDPPEIISNRIVTAIKQRKKDVYIGFPERLFVRLNAVMPRLVDAAVAGNDRKATKLFAA
jgi:short-subunit dehydrogenase